MPKTTFDTDLMTSCLRFTIFTYKFLAERAKHCDGHRLVHALSFHCENGGIYHNKLGYGS